MSSPGIASKSLRGGLWLFLLAGLVAGCAAPPARGPVPPPDLELLGAGARELPSDCEPRGGEVYRMSFLVQPDGRPSAVVSESGHGCVQDALRRWVSTFEYRPVAETRPGTLDWMSVTARRGD